MSESPPVVIAISSQTNIIKPQTYTNLSTIYNPSELLSAKSESDFYNPNYVYKMVFADHKNAEIDRYRRVE